MDPAEEAEISRAPACATVIRLLFPLWLDGLPATFLQGYFGCMAQAEHWGLFPITGDIHCGIKLSSGVASSNRGFAGKMMETLEGSGLGFPADAHMT